MCQGYWRSGVPDFLPHQHYWNVRVFPLGNPRAFYINWKNDPMADYRHWNTRYGFQKSVGRRRPRSDRP